MNKLLLVSLVLLCVSLSLQTIGSPFVLDNRAYVDDDLRMVPPGRGLNFSIDRVDDINSGTAVEEYRVTASFYDHEQERPICMDTDGNTLISVDNPDDNDTNPKITRNSAGTFAVTYERYEKKFHSSVTTNPILFSTDCGENWNLQFNVSSTMFNSSGFSDMLQSPNLVYNPNLDVFYYTAIDPYAEVYNDLMGFISGDIANADEMLVYATSACGDDYLENAATATENFFLSANIRDGQLNRYLDVFYVTYPDFGYPLSIAGYYPDLESVHKTSPASNIEMDTGNRIYLVAESGAEEGQKITVKSNTADENLITSGEQQNGMDKYADIEQWPGEYIADGRDPDVSAFGNKVYVVYTQNGTVKCSYSTAESGYEPKFNWQVSTVATHEAKCPAVYASGDKVICAYVKNGNLFIVTSEDGGASWGTPFQINEVNGTVVEEVSCIDIHGVGVVWTDTRNGNKDIYFELLKDEFFIPQIHISGGLGVTVLIENLGSLPKPDIWWAVTLDAAFLLSGRMQEGNVSLDAYDAIEVWVPVFGFGKLKIQVECKYDGYASANGFLVGPFVLFP